MAKRETKQTYGDVRQDRTSAQNLYTNQSAIAGQNAGNVAPFVAENRANIYGGYLNAAGGSAGSIPGIGSPGQVSTGRLGDVYGKFGEIADSGGYSPETRASILENVGGLKEIGGTGGYTQENIARSRGLGGFEQIQNEGGLSPEAQFRMRGGGGYDEFAATGGIDSNQRANIKAKAISPIGSYATGTRDELSRRLAVQGGYGPGFDAANRALQRDTSRAIADTSLNAELGIQDRVNQGRMFGIGGMAGSEGNLQNLRTGNILGATQGIAGAEQSMVANRTGNKLRGLESASNIESDLSGRIAQLRLQGMSGQQASAMAMAEIEGQNINRGIDVNKFNVGVQGQNFGNQMAGLGGLSNLYGTDMAQMQAERDRQLGLINQGQQANLGYLGQQSQLGMQPGAGSNIMKGIGTAAGIAGMIYTGGLSGAIGSGMGGGNGGAQPPQTLYPGVGGTQLYNPYPYYRGV